MERRWPLLLLLALFVFVLPACSDEPGDDDDTAGDDDDATGDDDDATGDDDDATGDDDDSSAGDDDDDSAAGDDDDSASACVPIIAPHTACPAGALVVAEVEPNETAVTATPVPNTGTEPAVCITGTIDCGVESDFFYLSTSLGAGAALDLSLNWTNPSSGAAEMNTRMWEFPEASGTQIFDGDCEVDPPEHQSTTAVFNSNSTVYSPNQSANGFDIEIFCKFVTGVVGYELVITGS